MRCSTKQRRQRKPMQLNSWWRHPCLRAAKFLFSDKANVVQMIQNMSDDNKEALDRLEGQNQEFLEAQREIDATFVQSMREVLAKDRAEAQRFITNSAYFIYFELILKGKLETMYTLRCTLRWDGSHSGDSNIWLHCQSGGWWLVVSLLISTKL
ncbi:uncharacterized protein LOC108035848 [Drosophila biarmipes]|uniref:uncharacterized protein LOC108035848 n=1 Tax=Drosophila biarmipes TaxID=125945 RepID=UPI0007E65878|nr:uncharacterized protein LOC108035848 [Drosophila biarmipes]XP_043949794.1 uncharacterized protein LOC122818760 [Drosophila biarmipes]XP_050745536.1 uncharacterized protein LOC108035848 [Drosophila biarmipes]